MEKIIDVWTPVPSFHGVYVNEAGMVKKRLGTSGSWIMTFGHKDQMGYFQTKVLGRNKRVHRLMALAFLPNPEQHPYVNHKNGIKTDNRLVNLEWCSSSYNSLHAYRLGLRRAQRGTANGKAKLTEQQVRGIFDAVNTEGMSCAAAGRKFSVSYVQAKNISSGSQWRHLNLGLRKKEIRTHMDSMDQQSKSTGTRTGLTNMSCGCVSNPNTGMNPIALPDDPLPVERNAEQPASGISVPASVGNFKANTGNDNP